MSAASNRPTRDERFAFRVRAGEKRLVEKAAAASGRWTSEFARDVLLRRARQVLREKKNDA